MDHNFFNQYRHSLQQYAKIALSHTTTSVITCMTHLAAIQTTQYNDYIRSCLQTSALQSSKAGDYEIRRDALHRIVIMAESVYGTNGFVTGIAIANYATILMMDPVNVNYNYTTKLFTRAFKLLLPWVNVDNVDPVFQRRNPLFAALYNNFARSAHNRAYLTIALRLLHSRHPYYNTVKMNLTKGFCEPYDVIFLDIDPVPLNVCLPPPISIFFVVSPYKIDILCVAKSRHALSS